MGIQTLIALVLVVGLSRVNAQDAQEIILGGAGAGDECHNTVILPRFPLGLSWMLKDF
jgi:hypothetical protein